MAWRGGREWAQLWGVGRACRAKVWGRNAERRYSRAPWQGGAGQGGGLDRRRTGPRQRGMLWLPSRHFAGGLPCPALPSGASGAQARRDGVAMCSGPARQAATTHAPAPRTRPFHAWHGITRPTPTRPLRAFVRAQGEARVLGAAERQQGHLAAQACGRDGGGVPEVLQGSVKGACLCVRAYVRAVFNTPGWGPFSCVGAGGRRDTRTAMRRLLRCAPVPRTCASLLPAGRGAGCLLNTRPGSVLPSQNVCVALNAHDPTGAPRPSSCAPQDSSNALTHSHFRAEGDVEFRAILYIPLNSPYDFYDK